MAKARGVQMGIIYGLEQLNDRHEKYTIIRGDVVERTRMYVLWSQGQPKSLLSHEV
jgi:hypothetical protein